MPMIEAVMGGPVMGKTAQTGKIFQLDIFPFEDYRVTKNFRAGRKRSIGERQFSYSQSNYDRVYRAYDIIIEARDDGEVDQLESFRDAHQFNEGEHDFLIDDVKDNHVDSGTLGTGDGSTTLFNFVKDYGYGNKSKEERIHRVDTGTVTVFTNGSVEDSSNYRIDNVAGQLEFHTAPSSGTTIEATFDYYRRVQFINNAIEEQQSSNNRWEIRVRVGEVE